MNHASKLIGRTIKVLELRLEALLDSGEEATASAEFCAVADTLARYYSLQQTSARMARTRAMMDAVRDESKNEEPLQ